MTLAKELGKTRRRPMVRTVSAAPYSFPLNLLLRCQRRKTAIGAIDGASLADLHPEPDLRSTTATRSILMNPQPYHILRHISEPQDGSGSFGSRAIWRSRSNGSSLLNSARIPLLRERPRYPYGVDEATSSVRGPTRIAAGILLCRVLRSCVGAGMGWAPPAAGKSGPLASAPLCPEPGAAPPAEGSPPAPLCPERA